MDFKLKLKDSTATDNQDHTRTNADRKEYSYGSNHFYASKCDSSLLVFQDSDQIPSLPKFLL